MNRLKIEEIHFTQRFHRNKFWIFTFSLCYFSILFINFYFYSSLEYFSTIYHDALYHSVSIQTKRNRYLIILRHTISENERCILLGTRSHSCVSSTIWTSIWDMVFVSILVAGDQDSVLIIAQRVRPRDSTALRRFSSLEWEIVIAWKASGPTYRHVRWIRNFTICLRFYLERGHCCSPGHSIKVRQEIARTGELHSQRPHSLAHFNNVLLSRPHPTCLQEFR